MSSKKRYNKKVTKKEVIIQENISHQGDFYDEDIEEFIKEENAIDPRNKKTIIRLGIILLTLIIAMVVVFNWQNLTFSNLKKWVSTSISGTGFGDGFPVTITGTDVDVGNFVVEASDCVTLSDTTFVIINSTGNTTVSVGHSYNSPMLSANSGNYLVYDIGSTGYTVIDEDGEYEKITMSNNITTGSMSSSGVYGIVTQSEEYTSELSVFDTKDQLIYTYKFSSDYVTSLSLNDDGTKCVITSINSSDGSMYSNIQVLSFDNTDPVAKYVSTGNLIVQSYWSGSNVYCVGDQSTVVFNQSYDFHEYSYDGKMLTTMTMENGRAFVAVSGYEYSGASTLLVFNGTGEPSYIETENKIDDISSYGSEVVILTNHMVEGYDLYSLKNNESCEVGYDTKGVSMINESEIYTVGISEIDNIKLDEKK